MKKSKRERASRAGAPEQGTSSVAKMFEAEIPPPASKLESEMYKRLKEACVPL